MKPKPKPDKIPVPCVMCPTHRPGEVPNLTMNGICRWCRPKVARAA